ncbi:hypothetical protein ACFV0O_08745 [Kitasatospora sp. NPDC059577]|uniref:hypothetical protein n=1 Tax=unclassified Kitasatospora TaxID=2633591 RepID=UPI00369752C9
MGVVFPGWVPLAGGRRVPHRTLAATAFTVATFLLLYTAWAAALTVVQWNEPGIFSRWIVVYGIPQFLLWGFVLLIAARSYRSRTTPRPPGPVRWNLCFRSGSRGEGIAHGAARATSAVERPRCRRPSRYLCEVGRRHGRPT